MREGIGYGKGRKKEEVLFRRALLCTLSSVLFCLAASFFERGQIVYMVMSTAAVITFSVGLVLLCLAGAEGIRVYLMEEEEELSREQQEELDAMLWEAWKKATEKEHERDGEEKEMEDR